MKQISIAAILTGTLPLGVHAFSLGTGIRRARQPLSPASFRSTSTSSLHVSGEVSVSASASESSQDQTQENDDAIQLTFIEPGPNLIPPDAPDQVKLEKEFYSMMREFAEFTPKDVASVPDPRYRSLYHGVAAGANEPEVMNAFSIVYQDLMPVRVAGKMIYRHLKNTMEECTEERDKKEKELEDEYGLDMPTINHGRRAYMAVMQDDAKGELTMAGLVDSGIVNTISELLGFETFEEFVEVMDTDANEKLTFENFIVGLQRCQSETSCDVNCNLSEVLQEIIKRMEPLEAKKKEVDVQERQRKYSDRYDEMVKTFEEWEKLVPSSDDDGRMMQVLQGSFAGAKNDKIVKALKIVYMDYSALRVGGDLVFKLMSKLMARREKKRKKEDA